MSFSTVEMRLAQFFVQREGQGVLEVLRDEDLVESGILDSLDLVILATFIEEEFAIKLDLADPKTFEAARRFDSLVSLLGV